MFTLKSWPTKRRRHITNAGRKKQTKQVFKTRPSPPDTLDVLYGKGFLNDTELTTARWYESLYWTYTKSIDAPMVRKSRHCPLPLSGEDWTESFMCHVADKWRWSQEIIHKQGPNATNQMHRALILKSDTTQLQTIKHLLSVLEKEMPKMSRP